MKFNVKVSGFLWALLFAVLLGIGPLPSFAQSDDNLFVIRNLVIDKTAENAVQARDIAISEGQREAYEMLSERLLGEEVALQEATDAEISRMISDFETSHEKFSDKRYRAEMTVRFRADAVKSFLGKSQTADLADIQSKPVLVLPFIRDPQSGKSYLWSRDNSWLEAWQRHANASRLVPVIVPRGDHRDVSLVSENDILSGNPADVETLKKAYQADQVIIAEAVLTAAGVEIDIYEYIADSLSQTKTVSAATDGAETQKWAVAVHSVQEYLNDNWKKQLRYSSNMLGNQKAVLVVRFDDMRDWLRIKQLVERNDQIKNLQMRSLKRGHAEMQATLSGDAAKLENSFASQNLVFRKSNAASGTVYEIYQAAAPRDAFSGYNSGTEKSGALSGNRTIAPYGSGRDPLQFETVIDPQQIRTHHRYVQP